MKNDIDACVIYTDGSCNPNPGIGGWGFHGYTYKNETPTKPLSGVDSYITDKGYVEKSMMDSYKNGNSPLENVNENSLKDSAISIIDESMDGELVNPVVFLDYFGPAPKNEYGLSTNNTGELYALLMALEYINKNNIKKSLIYADSEYVIQGYKKHLYIWNKNGWKRADGQFIRNKEIWQNIFELKNSLKDFDITIKWLPGHSVFLGNQLADLNANLGRALAKENITKDIESEIDAKLYYKQLSDDKNPLMCHQKLFFNATDGHKPGVYYMGAIDADIGMFGKKLSDTSYSYVVLDKPVDSIESLISRHKNVMALSDDTVVAHLNTFYKPELYKNFSYFGNFVLDKHKYNDNNMSYADKHLITEIVNPPKKSLEAVLAMNNIALWTEEWINNKTDRFVATDITDEIFEQVIIKKRKSEVIMLRLKDSIKQNTESIYVFANYKDKDNNIHRIKTTLSLGIDILDRSGLKKIESLNPNVQLLTFRESSFLYRYFTIIKTDCGYGSYCGYYSNTKIGI